MKESMLQMLFTSDNEGNDVNAISSLTMKESMLWIYAISTLIMKEPMM